MADTVACAQCGAPIDPTKATYDKGGNLICRGCDARGVIAEGESRAVSSMAGGAVGIGVAGLFSLLCFNPFLILSFITVASSVGWILTIVRFPEYRSRMGWRFVPSLVVVCLGITMASFPVLAVLGIGVFAFATSP